MYQALKQMGFDGETLLFHAGFPAEWRQEIEAQCIRWFGKDKSHRPKKAILVATQVVEHLMENEAMSSASTQYLIRSPGKGFSPMKTPESIQFDDLEQSGFLSAKTRLGPPTKRIVLLEEEAFCQLAERAKKVEGIRILDNLSKNEEKDLLKQSVSIQEKKLEGKQSSTEVLYGRKRLEGLWVLRGEQKDGTIFYHNMKLDHELGIRFQS